jgi:hypothetical protein
MRAFLHVNVIAINHKLQKVHQIYWIDISTTYLFGGLQIYVILTCYNVDFDVCGD